MPRPYKLTHFDVTIADIASRFHIDSPSTIVNSNSSILAPNSEYRNLTSDLLGQTIQLPDDPNPDEYVWETYVSPGNELLSAVCAAKNKDRRIDPRGTGGAGITAPPWLVTQWVLDLYRNAEVRAAHGPDAAPVMLAKGEVVMVPFPRAASQTQTLNAAAQGRIRVALDPPWLLELRSIYESIASRTRSFERGLARMRELQRQGLDELSVLYPLKAVMRMTIDHPSQVAATHTSEIATLRTIDSALDDFGAAAMDAMNKRVAQLARPTETKTILDLGAGILADLRSDRFDELTGHLAAEHILHPVAINELSDALAYAFQILEDSPLADDAAKDVDTAAAFLASVRSVSGSPFRQVDPELADAIDKLPAARPPSGALGTLVSALGTFSSSVGNVAGPSTLFVAIVRLRAVRMAKTMADAIVGNVKDILGPAAIIKLSVNALCRTTAEQDELISLEVAIRQGQADIKLTPFLSKVDAAIAGRTMATPLWLKGMGVVNIVAIGLAILDIRKRGITVQNAPAFLSAVAGSASVVATVLFTVGKVSARTMSTVGLTASGVGVGVALWQTGLSASQNDTTGTVINGIGAAGAILLAASMVPNPFAIEMAVVGGVLVVGSGVASVARDLSGMSAEDWRDILRSRPKIWWLRQEALFETGRIFQAVAPGAPSLTAKATALRQAIDSASFLQIDSSQHDSLAKLVPDDASLQALLAP